MTALDVEQLHITRLANGLTVATECIPSALSVSAGAWVGVGARDETAEMAGVSHFLEHLLFKGSDAHSAREISQMVDRVGGDINAFTAKEYTAYYTRVPARHQAMAIELLGEVLTRPALRPDDVDNERQVILEERNQRTDNNPESLFWEQLLATLYVAHPSTRPRSSRDGRDRRGDHRGRHPPVLRGALPQRQHGGGGVRPDRPRRDGGRDRPRLRGHGPRRRPRRSRPLQRRTRW
ncbi:MAG TPA: pitrilysin family protein [Ilumatobacteraceae bacterium]|nr:pitrilysin family protein [Ilumatobacteraceae bacterium]